MDIYPNSIQTELKQILDESVSETIKNRDVIKEVRDWFLQQIKDTESIDQIWAAPETRPEDVKIQILAKKHLKILLESKKNEFEHSFNVALAEIERRERSKDE